MKFKKIFEGMLVYRDGTTRARLTKIGGVWRGTVHQNDRLTYVTSGTYNETRKAVTEFVKN